MGIIKRQGIKNSIVNYVGVIIGMFNTIYIYPNYLNEYGAAQWFMETSTLLIPFVLIGMDALAVRFFPNFHNKEKGHHGFLFLLMGGAFIGMTLFTILFLVAQPFIVRLLEVDSLIQKMLICLIPLTCFRGMFELLTKYTSNFHRIVIPGILNQLNKFSLPVLIILFMFQKIPAEWIIYGVVLNYLVVLIIMLLYLRHLGELQLKPNFNFLKKPLVQEMKVYAGYGILGLLGTFLATKIDSVMVGIWLGDASVGKYSILLTMSNVVAIPTIALMKITSPIVADAWNKKDLPKINELYQKTSINLLIVGVLIFIGIWVCLEDLFEIMPRGAEISAVKNIFLFIGLSKLVDMVTSINSFIIGYSKYFRFNFYAVLTMAVFNVIMNLIFIPLFDEVGAAMATLGTVTCYNLLKFGYVKYRFDMIPFTSKTLIVLLIGGAVYVLTFFLAQTPSPYLNILIKAVLITGIYGILILKTNVSPDINELVVQGKNKFLGFFRR